MIGIESTTQEESLAVRLRQKADAESPYGLKAFERERVEILTLSASLGSAIDHLLNAQGKLGDAFNMLLMSDQPESKKVQRKARKIVESVTKEAKVAAVLTITAQSPE